MHLNHLLVDVLLNDGLLYDSLHLLLDDHRRLNDLLYCLLHNGYVLLNDGAGFYVLLYNRNRVLDDLFKGLCHHCRRRRRRGTVYHLLDVMCLADTRGYRSLVHLLSMD